MFFGAGFAPFLPLDDERSKFVAVDFCEDYVDVREAAVRDEHLFTVKNIMSAVGAEPCRGFRGHRVRA